LSTYLRRLLQNIKTSHEFMKGVLRERAPQIEMNTLPRQSILLSPHNNILGTPLLTPGSPNPGIISGVRHIGKQTRDGVIPSQSFLNQVNRALPPSKGSRNHPEVGCDLDPDGDALTVGEEVAGDCTADCEGEGDTAKDEVTGCGCESLGVHHLLEELMGLDICFWATYTGPRHKG